MGWSSGSRLMSKVISATKKGVRNENTRKRLYRDFIKAFEDADWDNIDECMGEDPAFDAAAKELHPNWFEDEED